MKKCKVCGRMFKFLVSCDRCGKDVCLFCYEVRTGLCGDCETLVYNEKYRNKIKEYEKANIIVNA